MIIKNRNIENGDKIKIEYRDMIFICQLVLFQSIPIFQIISDHHWGEFISLNSDWLYGDNIPEILLNDDPIKLELK